HVAVSLSESFFAVHHTCACFLTKFFYHLCCYCCHLSFLPVDSICLEKAIRTESRLSPEHTVLLCCDFFALSFDFRFFFALFRFDECIRHLACQQAYRADCVIVCRDDVIDFVRIAVRVDDADNRDVQLLSFCNRNAFFAWVNDVHNVRKTVHVTGSAEELDEASMFFLELDDFFLRKDFESSFFFHALDCFHAVNALLDRTEVRQKAAEPALVDVVLASAFRFFTDCILCLFFSSDEEHFAAFCTSLAHEVVCFLKFLDRLLKVDDVDAVTLHEDVFLHLRVPAACLVTEVDTCFKKLFHCDNCHFCYLRLVFWSSASINRRAASRHQPFRQDTCVIAPLVTIPRVYPICNTKLSSGLVCG